jgi:hypothetical protein
MDQRLGLQGSEIQAGHEVAASATTREDFGWRRCWKCENGGFVGAPGTPGARNEYLCVPWLRSGPATFVSWQALER